MTEPSPSPNPPETSSESTTPARQPGKLERLMAQYGKIGVITYFAIFFATWGGFAAAIAAGVQVESTAGGAGLLGASYLATKVTQPLRIAATFALTPILAAVWQRLAPKRKK